MKASKKSTGPVKVRGVLIAAQHASRYAARQDAGKAVQASLIAQAHIMQQLYPKGSCWVVQDGRDKNGPTTRVMLLIEGPEVTASSEFMCAMVYPQNPKRPSTSPCVWLRVSVERLLHQTKRPAFWKKRKERKHECIQTASSLH